MRFQTFANLPKNRETAKLCLANVSYFKVFLYGAYFPPKSTTPNILSKTNYFASLENSIFKYKDKGNIVIMGDLNARSGIEDYTLHLDNHISKLLPDTNSIQHRNRRPCDQKTKSYGRRYY